jgi:hypothetical protein
MVNFKLQRQHKQYNRRNKHRDCRRFYSIYKIYRQNQIWLLVLPYANARRFEDENQSAICGAIRLYVGSHNSKRAHLYTAIIYSVSMDQRLCENIGYGMKYMVIMTVFLANIFILCIITDVEIWNPFKTIYIKFFDMYDQYTIDKYTFYLDFKGVLSSTPQVSVFVPYIPGLYGNMFQLLCNRQYKHYLWAKNASCHSIPPKIIHSTNS